MAQFGLFTAESFVYFTRVHDPTKYLFTFLMTTSPVRWRNSHLDAFFKIIVFLGQRTFYQHLCKTTRAPSSEVVENEEGGRKILILSFNDFLLRQIILASISFANSLSSSMSSSRLSALQLPNCTGDANSSLLPFLRLTELCSMHAVTRRGYCEILVVGIARNFGRACEIARSRGAFS